VPSSICHEEADDVSDQKNRSQKANAELLSSRNSHHWARLFGLLSNLPALNKWHPRRVDVIMLRRTLTEAPRSCHIAIPANHEVKDQIITKTSPAGKSFKVVEGIHPSRPKEPQGKLWEIS